jgi:hypothetical protein
MEIPESAHLAYTRVILTHTLRELRRPVRRTQLIQRLRRWTGRPFVDITQKSRKPTEVGLTDTGITPLWESNTPSPATSRATLGQTWTISHNHHHTAINLVVDHDATAWLISATHDRHPATPEGWRHMLATVTRDDAGSPNNTTDSTDSTANDGNQGR